jgi:hypothetical protein
VLCFLWRYKLSIRRSTLGRITCCKLKMISPQFYGDISNFIPKSLSNENKLFTNLPSYYIQRNRKWYRNINSLFWFDNDFVIKSKYHPKLFWTLWGFICLLSAFSFCKRVLSVLCFQNLEPTPVLWQCGSVTSTRWGRGWGRRGVWIERVPSSSGINQWHLP